MQMIELDGSRWTSRVDFYRALLAELGAPRWHGENINALIDSMIYGEINALAPPYTVRVTGMGSVPPEVRTEVEMAQRALAEARDECRTSTGEDVEARLEVEP